MQRFTTTRDMICSLLSIPTSLALVKLALHLYYCNFHGYMRDELYFIACGKHMDWGYVDIGPLVPWLSRLTSVLFGESLLALRLPSAIAGAATVYLTTWLARYLGGGRTAQLLAGLSVIIAPIWLQAGNILSLPSFESLFWMACICLIAVIIKTGNRRLWLAVGVIAGIGLLNKPSMVFFGIGLTVGLVLTKQRKFFADKWLWAGGAIVLLIATPNIAWQAMNDWPTWEFVYGMNRDLMSHIPRWLFLVGQVVYEHPLNVPLWTGGTLWLFFSKRAAPYRVLAWIPLTVLTLLLITRSKIYYAAPAFPVLLAAGGIAIESILDRYRLERTRLLLPVILLLGCLVTLPIGLPVLSMEHLKPYVRTITFGALDRIYEVTGTWHDQFGWENQVATVSEIFHTLTPEEQADCMIFVSNFGQAGALDFYGPRYGLPHATCVHQNYFFWGPPQVSGKLAIIYGFDEAKSRVFYDEVKQVAVISCPECMPFEDNLGVYICRWPRLDLKAAWPVLRMVALSNTGVSPETLARLLAALEPYRINQE